MAVPNPLNVFRGEGALRKFFNPDEQPPVPLVELPEKLNPFRQSNVRIFAKLLTFLPAQNVKALPGKPFVNYHSCAMTFCCYIRRTNVDDPC
jgi:cysteine synthase A